MSNDVAIKAYEEASKYILRELNLINNRLTWILTIHGFLYATYGFTIQKQLEIIQKIQLDSGKAFLKADYPICASLTQSEAFLFTIASVGLLISFLGLISIRAACDAMNNVASIFTQSNLKYFKEDDINGYKFYTTNDPDKVAFPHLLGGGRLIVNGRGNAASMWIPTCLLLSWLGAIGVCGAFYKHGGNLFCSIF